MSRSDDPVTELGLLIAALCDGEITPEEAARLEQLVGQSDEARRYFLHYVQLHGELYWENAVSAGVEILSRLEPSLEVPVADQLPQAAGVPSPVRRTTKSPILPVAVAAAAVLFVALAWWGVAGYRGSGANTPEAITVARLTGTAQAKWSESDQAQIQDRNLVAGQPLRLVEGLAEITFHCGARVILQGPASFNVDSARGGFLRAGRLTANIPAVATGFAIRTPPAVAVDLGTEFGVAVEENGPCEIHVFAGAVEVRPGSMMQTGGTGRKVRAGEAVKILVLAGGGPPEIHEIAVSERHFVRHLPGPALPVRSVAALRATAARHPNLIHHYTFEGTSRAEKRRDKRGELHLVEAVMHQGRGRGKLDYVAQGLDATTEAVRPYRDPISGNTSGVGLQSDATFHPPDALTVELLLNYTAFPFDEEGLISTAVATRAVATDDDLRDCGFFVVTVDDGRLAHLMDGEADWTESGFEFIPGDWYYVAGTFRVESGQTTINSYVANLSRGEQTLRRLVKGWVAPGAPGASRLGIGKGFDQTIAHAYPWSGAIDEVAIYDAVLDQKTLQEHLRAMTGEPLPSQL